MSEFVVLPATVKRSLARLGYQADRLLLGGRGGRIARLFNGSQALFVNPEIGNAQALRKAFATQGIRHAVLGGTEETVLAGDRMLTVLVADEDVAKVRRLVTFWPTGTRCAVYCPSGIAGFAFGDMALLPPKLARQLLDGARNSAEGSRPDPCELFFCCVYRDLYLRGLDAGIASTLAGPAGATTTPRGVALAAEASRLGLGLEGPPTMEMFDALLARHGWRAPIEILERVGCWNRWVALKLESEGHGPGSEAPGLTVFFLRQRALDAGAGQLVRDTLAAEGFRLIELPALPHDKMAEIASEVRGGNWGRGPWPVSGGEPGAILLGFDPFPIPPDEKTLIQFPLLDNLRINTAKNAVRDAVQAGLPRRERYNPLHSTDNAVQAWRTVRTYYPNQIPGLRAELTST